MTDITSQPLAQALLRKLAATRGADDPLGSLARTVVEGRASLREAAAHSWHREALVAGFASALDRQRAMSAVEREEIRRTAQHLQAAADPERDTQQGDGDRKESR